MKRMLLLLASIAAALAAAAPAPAAGSPVRCPPVAPGLAVPGAGATGSLVRAGARSLLLCRYRGLNPAATAHRLRASRLVTAHAEIAALTAGLNALPSLSGPVNCPLDDGSEIVATFRYAAGGDDVVRIGLTGCRLVTGRRLPVRFASGPAGQRLLAQLAALVR
jgi:hypothetical protein